MRMDYTEVADRIQRHRDDTRSYPDGSFQSEWKLVEWQCDGWGRGCPGPMKKTGDRGKGKWYQTARDIPHEPHYVPHVVVEARFYRTPDDQRPGVGLSWMRLPGSTQYTRGSELENAETSARGRALVAALASDSRASADEVRAKAKRPAAKPAPAGPYRAETVAATRRPKLTPVTGSRPAPKPAVVPIASAMADADNPDPRSARVRLAEQVNALDAPVQAAVRSRLQELYGHHDPNNLTEGEAEEVFKKWGKSKETT